jgi:broad specificity phosphatase PhoE
MGTRFLYLVRHGQMQKGEMQDELGNGLTALGRRQARRAGRRLSDLPVDVIHHSPLRRAAETAAIVHAHLPQAPLQMSPLLEECLPGWPIHVRQYFQNTPRAEVERGRVRAERALLKFFRPTRGADRHEIVVAHGNIIRYFLLSVLGAKPKMWTHCDIHNAGLSEVQVLPDGVMMVTALNDTGHLPRQWLTFI